jgi:hypothetical protein
MNWSGFWTVLETKPVSCQMEHRTIYQKCLSEINTMKLLVLDQKENVEILQLTVGDEKQNKTGCNALQGTLGEF